MFEPFSMVAAKLARRSTRPGLPEVERTADPKLPLSLLAEVPAAAYAPFLARSAVDYSIDLLRFAASQGGKIGRYRMPEPWLQMTIDSLEGRSVRVEEMWVGRRPTGQNLRTRCGTEVELQGSQ